MVKTMTETKAQKDVVGAMEALINKFPEGTDMKTILDAAENDFEIAKLFIRFQKAYLAAVKEEMNKF